MRNSVMDHLIVNVFQGSRRSIHILPLREIFDEDEAVAVAILRSWNPITDTA